MLEKTMEQQVKEQCCSVVREKVSGVIDEKTEAAVCKLVEIIFAKQGGDADDMMRHLEKLSNWIEMMPRSLHPEKPWSRAEFEAVLMGPVDRVDPRLEDYMDSFYEEYKGNSEDENQEFYMKLFQSEQRISEVDWMSIWGSFYASYERQLEETEADIWLQAGAGNKSATVNV